LIIQVQKNDEREITEAVKRAVDQIEGLEDIVSPGDLVLVKPNLVRIPPSDNGTATRWKVSKAVADLVIEFGARAVKSPWRWKENGNSSV